MKHCVCDLEMKRTVEVVYTGGSVEWSVDGSTLYSICSNVVKVINLDNENLNYVIGDPEEGLRITCICLDNSRSRLIVAYNNQVIREYSLLNSPPDIVRTWKTLHTAPILCMSITSDALCLATGSADHYVKVWDLVQQHCVNTFKGVGVVSTLLFIQNNRLMVGYIQGDVRMFDIARGVAQKLIREWKPHCSRITGFVELSSLQRVIVFSRDQTASVINIVTGGILQVLPFFEAIEGAILAHNGNVVTVGEEGLVKEWLIEPARLLRSMKISCTRLDYVKYNCIRNELLITSDDHNIFLLNFEKFKLSRQIIGFHDEVYSCSLLGEDDSHLAVASNTKEIRLYDTKTWDCQMIEGHSESVLCISTASFNRCLIASSSKDGSIILWMLDIKVCYLSFYLIRIVCFYEYLSNRMSETTNKVVQLAYATGHTNSVNAVCFSHSGKRPFLISVSLDTTIKLWSLVELTALIGCNIHVEEIHKLSCSSTLVAHSKDVTSVDVSLSNSVSITGSLDKMVKLWHIDEVKMRLGIAGTLSGHRRGVSDVKLSPNSLILFVNRGSQLISADSAGIIKIWTLTTSETDKSIEAHSDKIWALLVNKDESEYISAGADGRIVIWKDVSEDRKLEKEAKMRKQLEEEQTLNNLLEQGRLQEALEYALSLARPFCTLKVIDKLHDCDELISALIRLDDHHIQTLLDFVTQWNTSSKTSLTSQTVLNCLIKILPPEKFLAIPNIKSVVESLIPYTRSSLAFLHFLLSDRFLTISVVSKMSEDLPMEEIDDMPELIDVDSPSLPSLINYKDNSSAKEADGFCVLFFLIFPALLNVCFGLFSCKRLMAQTLNISFIRDRTSLKVSRRKRKIPLKDVDMEERTNAEQEQQEKHAQSCEKKQHENKKFKMEKSEMRKIPVPKHRFTPLKDNWVNIFTPIVKNLGLQVSRAIGRIAGKDGRTKLVIENVTKTRIVLADTKIHLLGAYQNLRIARNAVCSLILGAPPSKVYGNLRNLASRSKERL
ncbi:Utp13 specific WD40 associated domain protein [Dictyocaulus viviparus]|uniref:Utp13 specific WD40 associated domain protein n=1 Tax=Dictyocaulus viviparus TaxID=29172 RepID=A0A0D8XU15_DICVI|nr:Utp13 specific WD40 associated domain protein [Dictyocaulus viviparus]